MMFPHINKGGGIYHVVCFGLIFIVLGSVCDAAVTGSTGCGCSVIKQSEHSQVKFCHAKYVVKGLIIDKRMVTNKYSSFEFRDNMLYKVEVRRVFKGVLQKGEVVEMTADIRCDPEFEENETYLISADSDMKVGLCLWNSVFSLVNQQQKIALKYIYGNQCDSCQLIEARLFTEPPPSSRCFYDPEGDRCVRTYSSCIQGPDGNCSWDQNEGYELCIQNMIDFS